MALLIYMSMPQWRASLELPHSSTGVWAQGNNARGQGSTFVGSLISFQCAWENKTEVERQDPYPTWWFVTDLSGPQHKHGGWLSFPLHMVLEKAWNCTVGSAAASQAAQHPSRCALTISFSCLNEHQGVSSWNRSNQLYYHSAYFSRASWLNVPGHVMDVKGWIWLYSTYRSFLKDVVFVVLVWNN